MQIPVHITGDDLQIHLEEGGRPYNLSTPKRVSVPYLKSLEEELSRMLEMRVIKKVTDPTDWCHPIVVVPNNELGRVRIC